MDSFSRRYERVGLLLIDDVQFLTGRRETQAELLRLFERMQTAGGQVVLTSDRPPAEIPDVDERLISRLSGGLIVDVTAPDYETRVAILRANCEERGLEFKSGVLEELARFNFNNVRALQGALNRLVAAKAVERGGAAGTRRAGEGANQRAADGRVREFSLRSHDRRAAAGRVVAGAAARGDRVLERRGLSHGRARARADASQSAGRCGTARDVHRRRRASARSRSERGRSGSRARQRSRVSRSRAHGRGGRSRRARARGRDAARRPEHCVYARRVRNGHVEPARRARGRRRDHDAGLEIQSAADPRRERRGEDAPAPRDRQRARASAADRGSWSRACTRSSSSTNSSPRFRAARWNAGVRAIAASMR